MLSNDDARFQYMGNTPSSDVPILKLIVCSTIVNIIFYNILPSSLTPLIKSYIISTFHAFISVISVIHFFLRYQINFKQINRISGGGVYGSGDEIMVYSVCYSSGYFIYDFFLMCIFKSVRSNSALVHHILILISVLSGLFNRVCHPCHFYLLAEELSTIPLNLKTIYRNRPRLYHLFSLLFVFCFFLSRLIYGTIICGYAFRSAFQFIRMAWKFDDISNLIRCLLQASLCLLTRILNIYWAILISQKLLDFKPSKSVNNQIEEKKRS